MLCNGEMVDREEWEGRKTKENAIEVQPQTKRKLGTWAFRECKKIELDEPTGKTVFISKRMNISHLQMIFMVQK